jgi:multicomponent Na+:H+ antiporter subunit E
MSARRLSGVGVWLVALWLLLWNDLSVANIVSGVAVAALVLAGARVPKVGCAGDGAGDRARIAPLSLLYFVGFVIVKLVQSNLVLAWEIVTPRNRINTGIVAVPLRTESELAMLVVSSVITLTPGTVTIDATGSPPVIYVNVLHLHDIDDVRRELLHIEELSVKAFGSRTARAQLVAARSGGSASTGEVAS